MLAELFHFSGRCSHHNIALLKSLLSTLQVQEKKNAVSCVTTADPQPKDQHCSAREGCIRKNFFTGTVVKHWNKASRDAVESPGSVQKTGACGFWGHCSLVASEVPG